MRYLFSKSKSIATLTGLMVLGSALAGGIPIASEQQPQAILVLGGEPSREKFAAQFALGHPNLPIWVSSGSPVEYSEYVFEHAGIDMGRVNLDYRAVDTVTNFTTLVEDFKSHHITDIYVITSDYHMPRARAIGNIVFGSRGIRIHPIAIPSQYEPEDSMKSLRDRARSVLWKFTGTALSKPQ